MLDFTSSLYLGMNHSRDTISDWQGLTTGKPVVLDKPMVNRCLEKDIANLTACENATLGPSTLHLFIDVFRSLSKRKLSIFLDKKAYPIARFGVENVIACGAASMSYFRHQNVQDLERKISINTEKNSCPVVVTDGYCPSCGKVTPLKEMLSIVEKYHGILIIDDTQALGILGESHSLEKPYGLGGGGSLRWYGLKSPNVIVISSLAKAFGAPLAVLAGSNKRVQQFNRYSQTRIHCSPPSNVAVTAAIAALNRNISEGDTLRARLIYLIRYLKKSLYSIGVKTINSLFPVQTLQPLPLLSAQNLHQHLYYSGIRTVIHRPRDVTTPRVSLILTSSHSVEMIDKLTQTIRSIYTDQRVLTN